VEERGEEERVEERLGRRERERRGGKG